MYRFDHLLTYLLNFSIQRTRRKLQLPANSDDDNVNDKGSSTNLSSLKAGPHTSTNSPLKPETSVDQETTEPKKVDNLEPKISEVSEPTEKTIVPIFNPIPQSSTIFPHLGDVHPNQPSMSPEIVEKIVERSANVPMTNMLADDLPADDSIPESLVQEELFQEGDGAPFNPDHQGQDVSMSSKDKGTT